ncbi:FAD binding domain-containing protein [Psychromarinibacter halotolerans]|uniref:FAD binding domain-containing protein n=1 Tax=Psychromarinibacter halotolerans TaxID=1775175 RepID=A0ABV7GN40_9RHOB|nr:xanthine dehydrogenase family protein subunit M [Psychromarinibacter halotolerans]MDF0597332.1 xanthine dehydrogenase family protein subunit M [Psychromarinibacter halotolerans]
MNLFDYLRPGSVDEAVQAGLQPGAAFLAGGTNLLDLMKIGVAQPGTVVDITHLPGLDGIEALPGGGWKIGALVRNADLARDPAFAAACPAVAEALLSGASAQLRNAATVGGNLMQRTRCSYFQDPLSACNRRAPGSGCAALGGVTDNHAVLGWTEQCIATHPSDFCVPLVALGATVEIAGADGRREVALEDFLTLPDADGPGGAHLAAGELITALILPAGSTSFACNARYVKLRERTSYAFALVSAAAMLRMDGDTIAEARIALGGVAARPWRLAEAEAALVGQHADATAFAKAADLLVAGARASGDNAHKIELARRIAVRALTNAATGTPERMPALPASVFENGADAHA